MARLVEHRARLEFSLRPDIARAVHGALLPEVGGAGAGETPKSRARPALVERGLAVDLFADDLPSLRAAVNSHLRWVDAAVKAAFLAD